MKFKKKYCPLPRFKTNKKSNLSQLLPSKTSSRRDKIKNSLVGVLVVVGGSEERVVLGRVARIAERFSVVVFAQVAIVLADDAHQREGIRLVVRRRVAVSVGRLIVIATEHARNAGERLDVRCGALLNRLEFINLGCDLLEIRMSDSTSDSPKPSDRCDL